ncbi:Down syndrome cell adhesion molecule-like protein Dscam2 [Nymphon striatum]|nr:Down syndrome cell adhesion molecule-like protein Dscam2 [Nymphon striatum]KAG1671040.1 Down syndrome cell adhesion molecule-like protein Dscam2 [Nymphon striatum]KAG1671042.1 Down syndrome cell adhesion molecule-like protein Dscam2 [Nymphon striatum]KAG1671043.1 Down syndrome cell adhesion molecule-like protein Dscam2 [Nymphon striatum]KAG1671044.1 Down syndrome cell adhesion molecule-like protein Dscam2 [Nymphon striatum]
MTETGNLLITDVTDSGTLDLGYWCQVKNKMFGETFLSQTAGKIIRTDSQGGVGPVITEILDQISIEKFQDINLTCAAQGSPPPSFKWKFQKTGDIVSTHQVLSLKNLKRHGTFMYTCIAENRFGIDKRDTKVVVRSQIEVFIEPNIKVVDSGSKIKLECNANGYPIQKVKWILNGKSVKFGVKIKAISSGRTLEIVSANREHEGMYQCFVSNSWQEVQSTAQIVLGGYSNYVNIYGLPVVHELQNVTVAAGQDAVVRCFVSGHPIKNIVWERDRPSISGYNYVLVNLKEKEPFSEICSINRGDEPIKISWRRNGRIIILGHGIDIATTKMYSVLQIREVKEIAPKWIMKPIDVHEIIGGSATINCKAGGYPEPTIKWAKMKGRKVLTLLRNNNQQSVYPNGSLHFINIQKIDSGKYSCIASNGIGEDLVHEINLKIKDVPVITYINGSISVSKNQAISLQCNAVGTGTISIKWIFKNNVLEDNDKRITITRKEHENKIESILNINNAKENLGGIYHCRASNKNGHDEKQLTLRIKGSFENGETKSMNGTMHRKRSTPTSTLDRRYGRLERPLPMPRNDSKSNLQDEYEIPDYCLLSHFNCETENLLTGPVFIKEPSSVVEFLNTEGSHIHCAAHGEPHPEIRWFNQDGLVEKSSMKSIPSLVKIYSNGTLEFKRFSTEQFRQDIHSTVYICSASNLHGTITSSPVSVRAVTKQQQQQIQAQVYDEYVVAGNAAVLKCHIPAFYKDDLHVVAWIREDNVIINQENLDSTRKITETGNLLITEVSPEQPLNLGYWCQVKNKLTGDTFLSQTAGRIILTESQGGVGPVITDISEIVYVEKGQRVNLTCAGQGSPPPTYKWKYQITGKIVSRSSILTFINEKNHGTSIYTCITENRFGIDKRGLKTPLEVFIKPSVQVVNSGSEFKLKYRSLVISSASREDEGMYQCFVSNKWQKVQSTAQIILGYLSPKFLKTFKSRTIQPGPSISLKCAASGEYGCIAKNEVNSVIYTNKINVYGLPQVYDLQNVTVAAGQDAEIRCYVSGYPLQEIIWEKAGRFSNLPKNAEIEKDGTLIIKAARKKNSGKYTCLATNGRSQTSQKSTYIKVLTKPSLLGFEYQEMELDENEPFSAICSVNKGDEPIKIYWMKNNLTVILGHGTDIATTKMYSVLQIREVNGNDAGNYTCIARNEAGFDMRTVNLMVSETPKWHIEPKDVIGKIGGIVIINCKANGYPKPTIQWVKMKGRKVIPFLNTSERQILHTNGSLQFSNIQKSDAGRYSCISSNGIGDDLVKEITLQIKDIPIISHLNESVSIKVGVSVYIHCYAKGEPPVTIAWSRNGDVIRQDQKWISIMNQRTLSEIKSILNIKNARESDGGNYECKASNKYGHDSKRVKVNIHQRHFDNDLKSLNGTINRKRGTPTSTYDRRYGKLEMPVTRNDSKSNVQEEYEIPDYWIVIICKCESNGKITGPIFIKEPTSGRVEFLSSEGIQFDCTAHGDPYPKIQWLKQDGFEQEKEVVKIPSLVEIHRNGTLGLKSFRPDQFRQDIHATVYRCSASNIHGRIISGPVSVRGTTKQQQQQIQAQVYDEYVVTGNTGVLKCHIPAFYKDDLNVVSWVREDNRVSPDVFMTHNGHLHINSVTAEMNLNLGYWCQVKNRITEETFLSQSAGRIILTDPQGGVAPVITDIMKTVSIERGKAVKLSCAAQGSPPPTYEWMLDTDNKVASRQYDTIGPLEVSIRPSLQIADSGSRFSLSCNVHGHPIIRIKWVMNGKTLVENDNVVISSNGTLNVLFSTRKDEGMYQCFASNDWEEVQSTAQVILGDLSPKLTQVFKSKTLQPGPSISLTCIASGRPSPTIKWMHNGRYLQKNDRYVFKERSTRNGTAHSKLIIKSLRASDGGEYTCIATNNVSNTSHTAKVNVYGLPVIHAIDNVTVAAEQDALIRCYVSGHPIINIHWERDDIFSNLPENMYSFNNGTLVMKSAQKSNSGHYSCIAQNGRGQEDKKSTFIKVLTKPILLGLKYELAQMEEGDPFSAMCSVFKGDEPIKITWKHNNKPIELKHGTDIATTKMYSVLQIRDAKEQQKGNYSCIAVNEAGYDTRTIELKLNLAPKWLIEPENGDASLEGSISLHCQASGNPPPSIKWVKVKGRNMKPITNKDSNKVLHINGTLFIKNVNHQDGGEYSCIASNGVGRKLVKMIILRIKNIPMIKFLSRSIYARYGQNVTIMCEVTGGKMISIQWVRENEIIQQNQERFDVKVEKNNNGLRSTLSITELVEDDSGKYVCSARNNHGDSKKHMQLTVMPNGNPNEFTKANVSPTQITQTSQTEIVLKKDNFQEKSQKDAVNVENTANTEREIDNSLDKSEHELSQYDDHALAESKDPRFDLQNMNLKAVVFIVPAAAVVILLIAVIITIVVYLVIRNKNMKNKKNARRSKDYSGIDTLNRSVQGKNYDPTRSIDRRYGKLERPLPLPNCESDQEPYEIPDY